MLTIRWDLPQSPDACTLTMTWSSEAISGMGRFSHTTLNGDLSTTAFISAGMVDRLGRVPPVELTEGVFILTPAGRGRAGPRGKVDKRGLLRDLGQTCHFVRLGLN